VVEPTPAARQTARRLRHLAEKMPGARVGLVVNQVRDEDSLRGLQDELGLPLWARVPYDEAVGASERAGAALVDAAPGSRALGAAAELVSRLRALDGEGRPPSSAP
jgi:CO dehydrogenase nickel-insertion accessory protein CooC1